MTRRELIATAAAVPAAAIPIPIRIPSRPKPEMRIHVIDEHGTVYPILIGDPAPYTIGFSIEGQGLRVESTEHPPIDYRHQGPLAFVRYRPGPTPDILVLEEGHVCHV